MLKNSVIITGLGFCGGIGENLSRFKDRLWTGETMIHPITDGSQGILQLGAFLPPPTLDSIHESFAENDRMLGGLFKRNLRQAPDSILFLVQSALEAWFGSQVFRRHAPDRIGLVVGGTGISTKWILQAISKFEKSPEYLPTSYALNFLETASVGYLSSILPLRGPGIQISAASASGNHLIREGSKMLGDGEVDACLVVAAPSDWGAIEWKSFEKLGALNVGSIQQDPRSCCPFDSKHSGFSPGRASASMVLETYDESRTYEKSYGFIRGFAANLDGNHLPDPNVEGESRCMESCISRAGMNLDEVEYINSHGTASPLGDETELSAIEMVFPSNKYHPWINSTKAITGHCLNSAGCVEAVALLLQMHHGFIHGNIHTSNPISSGANLVGNERTLFDFSNGISNSFGFGGINTCIAFSKNRREVSN